MHAQPAYQGEVSPIPVSDSAGAVPYPFLGGIDSPKEELVDIDNDGDFDLFLLAKNNRVNFWCNAGTAASFDFILKKKSAFDTLVSGCSRIGDVGDNGKNNTSIGLLPSGIKFAVTY